MTPERLRALILQFLREARAAARALPIIAFPAVVHACLAPVYASGRHPSLLEKQLRLVWATLRGSV
jgi:hypothetical protein